MTSANVKRSRAVRGFVWAAAACAVMQASAAQAVILDWSFTALDGLTGVGTFTADQDAMDAAKFNLTSATGTIGGEAVTLSSYDGAGNFAYPTSPFLLDSTGIGFSTASGFYNLYEYFDGLLSAAYDCGALYCIEGPNAIDVTAQNLHAAPNLSITVRAEVPEPATWGLMILGFGSVGAALRQRRKLATA